MMRPRLSSFCSIPESTCCTSRPNGQMHWPTFSFSHSPSRLFLLLPHPPPLVKSTTSQLDEPLVLLLLATGNKQQATSFSPLACKLQFRMQTLESVCFVSSQLKATLACFLSNITFLNESPQIAFLLFTNLVKLFK